MLGPFSSLIAAALLGYGQNAAYANRPAAGEGTYRAKARLAQMMRDHEVRLANVPATAPSRQVDRLYFRGRSKKQPATNRPTKLTLRLTRKEQDAYSHEVLGRHTIKAVR